MEILLGPKPITLGKVCKVKLKSLFILLIIPLFSACSSIAPLSYDSPKSKVPVGSRIQLHDVLTFERGFSRSFIQYGQAKTFAQIEEREPYCLFYRYEPPQALQTVRTVQPDVFSVTRSFQTKFLASLQSTRVAASLIIPGLLNDDGQRETYLSSVMKITSDKQPEIREFKCSVFDDPYEENHVSVTQIRQVLGDLATIQIMNEQN